MFLEIQDRIEAACARAGRKPEDVKLVAVTKGHSADEIRERVLRHGHRVLGENRVQEWQDKASELDDVEWHFIGNLQRNKVKYCEGFSLIHSLNSVRLADELQKQGEKLGHIFRALVEVNVAGEQSKQGVEVAAAEALAHHAATLTHVRVEGLMTIAPYGDEPEQTRKYFIRLRELRDILRLKELSMGMSGDFEPAVEEGATLVRIGSALFG
ncbi:YggS family pyridoxal phosphate-dependent enzyme [soil metagenome]